MQTSLPTQLALCFSGICNDPGMHAYLTKRFQAAESLLEQDTQFYHTHRIPKGYVQALQTPNWTCIRRCMAWSKQPNCHVICINDTRYPQHLKDVHQPPSVLFVKGNPHLLNTRQIGMVGARNASYSGLMEAQRLASDLSNQYTITSGLALGIDSACHQGALRAQGATIAVLGMHVDTPPHTNNQPLYRSIATHGALVSETPPNTRYHKGMFPARNRIIAGLSAGVLLIESRKKSGTSITIACAMDQNKPVMVIPGPMRHPNYAGNHYWIQQGAYMIVNTQDIDSIIKSYTPYTFNPTSNIS